MSLANFLLRWTLGNERPPDRLEIALFRGAQEVQDPGYRRAEVLKGSWHIQNERVNTTATFGPFRGSVEWDRSLLMRGELVIDERQFPGGSRRAAATDVVRVDMSLDLKAAQ